MQEPGKSSNPLLEIYPSDHIYINYDSTQANFTHINLKNLSDSPIAFKIKTTSPQDFLVSPSQGYLRNDEEISVRINFKGTEDSTEKIHKFLIQAYASNTENVPEINWSNPNVQNNKVSLSFNKDLKETQFADSMISSGTFMKDAQFGDSMISSDTFRYSMDIAPDTNEEAENHKKELMTESKLLTSAVDKLKTEVEKAKHRFIFSQDLESLHRAHMRKSYTSKHLMIAVGVGIILGAFFMG